MKYGIKIYDRYLANIGLTSDIYEVKEFNSFSETENYIKENFEKDSRRCPEISIIRIIDR